MRKARICRVNHPEKNPVLRPAERGQNCCVIDPHPRAGARAQPPHVVVSDAEERNPEPMFDSVALSALGSFWALFPGRCPGLYCSRTSGVQIR